jgi:hypothetical protein
MISMEDCIAMPGLNEKEVMAIAEHEHVPEMRLPQSDDTCSKSPTARRRCAT